MNRMVLPVLSLLITAGFLVGCNSTAQQEQQEQQVQADSLLQAAKFEAVSGLTVKDGVATFSKDATIKARYDVPSDWKKIIIKNNVTLKGNFAIDKRDSSIEITGEGWNSVLDNTMTTYKKGGDYRDYANIRFACATKGAVLKLSNFVSKNPANFHISSWAPVEMRKMKIIETREQCSTDGVHGNGVKIYDSFISTYDDAVYVGETTWIEGTTIEHNRNGAPLQASWGLNYDGAKITVKNCKFIDTSSEGYNQGLIGWAKKDGSTQETVTIKFEGNNTWLVKEGAERSAFCTFSSGGNGAVTKAKVIQIGGQEWWSTKVEQRNKSNGTLEYKKQ